MIKCYVGNNIDRKPVIVSNTATLRSVLEDNEIDYAHGTTSLDGATLSPGDLDKTFEQLGISGEKCYLLNSVKTANAAEEEGCPVCDAYNEGKEDGILEARVIALADILDHFDDDEVEMAIHVQKARKFLG